MSRGASAIPRGYANFHQVTSGSCFVSVEDGNWIDGQSLFDRIDDGGVVRLAEVLLIELLSDFCGHVKTDHPPYVAAQVASRLVE